MWNYLKVYTISECDESILSEDVDGEELEGLEVDEGEEEGDNWSVTILMLKEFIWIKYDICLLNYEFRIKH